MGSNGGGEKGELSDGRSVAVLRGEVWPDLVRLEAMVEKEWRCVVVFFMLRQALAPCVEDLLLLDRALFLMEQGLSVAAAVVVVLVYYYYYYYYYYYISPLLFVVIYRFPKHFHVFSF